MPPFRPPATHIGPICPHCIQPLKENELVSTVTYPTTGMSWVEHIYCPGEPGYQPPRPSWYVHLQTAFGVVCGIAIFMYFILYLTGAL